MNASTTTTMLTGLLTLCLFSTATAVDFSGNLKGVTITDAQATNKAPVATFTYTQNGDIVTFDASGSSDPDGSISKYKWDFGNGTIAEGVTTSYTSPDAATLKVTLTVVDNNNGVAINQQIVTIATNGIADDFSTDTHVNYTILSGGLNISEGKARASGAWATTCAIHNKELMSIDQVVEADVYTDGANATGGLMFRVDKLQKTGYMAWFANKTISLSSYNAGTKKHLAGYAGNFTVGTYRLRAEISKNIIKIYVDGNLALQATDNTYTTGESIGLFVQPYGKNTLVTIDNLVGK